MKIPNKFETIIYGHFFIFNCVKDAEPLPGSSLLSNTKFSDISGAHLIDLGRMKG